MLKEKKNCAVEHSLYSLSVHTNLEFEYKDTVILLIYFIVD